MPNTLQSHFESLEKAARAILDAKRVLISTGAGMSADSGVSTYRDKEGRWRDFKPFTSKGLTPSEFANHAGYQQDPHQAWGFHEHIRQEIRAASPHAGYPVVTRLMERFGDRAFLLTTNVDGFHRDAGVSEHQLWERYGNIWELQCVAACHDGFWTETRAPLSPIDPETMRATQPPSCPKCLGPARPRMQMAHDEVFIEKPEGGLRYQRFIEETPDLYIIIGTVLWFTWPQGVTPSVISINPSPKPHARYDDPIAIELGAERALVGIEYALSLLT